jgi:hypothetical protein
MYLLEIFGISFYDIFFSFNKFISSFVEGREGLNWFFGELFIAKLLFSDCFLIG